MKRFSALILFGVLSNVTFAQSNNVIVGQKPSAVFTPTAGGYILRQPGPSHNLSTTPQPVNPPSGGIQGTGAFSGGKKFRLNGNQFEMGGVYDMPMPDSTKKAKVTAITPIPTNKMAKAVLKALPIVGNAYMAGELLQELADEWNRQDPTKNPIIDLEKGAVYEPRIEWVWVGGDTVSKFYSASQACAFNLSRISGSSPEIVSIWDNSGGGKAAHCRGKDQVGSVINFTLGQVLDAIKDYVPPDIVDIVADKVSPSAVGKGLDAVGDLAPMELPSDLPTTVAGPSISTGTKTENLPNGDTKTTTTTNNITYNQNNISIITTITTTIQSPDGTKDTTTTPGSSTSGEPQPQLEDKPTPGICDLFPDILACKKLDEPATEEIPKETRTIELQTGPTFSGGSCIPDVVVTVFGRSITVLAMAEPCRWISELLRPLILLFAAMSAVFIVIPRSD